MKRNLPGFNFTAGPLRPACDIVGVTKEQSLRTLGLEQTRPQVWVLSHVDQFYAYRVKSLFRNHYLTNS